MMTSCPVCHKSWPRALRHPFGAIRCARCHQEKASRLKYATGQLQAQEEARIQKHLSEWETMTTEEKAARAKMAESLWS